MLIAAALCVIAAGCSSDDDGLATVTTPTTDAPTAGDAPAATTEPAPTQPAPTEPAPTDAPAPTPAPSLTPSVDLRTLLADRGVAELTLVATAEGGPNPTLAWESIDGAATYWLVVLDGAGAPYWAWTGSDTTVRFGGGVRTEPNQTAALHEAMTWTVAAVSADGRIIAFSETGRAHTLTRTSAICDLRHDSARASRPPPPP